MYAIRSYYDWLGEFMPLEMIELSHFLASLVGAVLLLLARGLQRRLDGAYIVTVILLAVGSILSLTKGGDYEEAITLLLILAALLPCRRFRITSYNVCYTKLLRLPCNEQQPRYRQHR